MPFPTSLRIAILAAICGTASPISLAQGPPKDEVLSGPAVNDRAVPGATSDFGDAKGRRDKHHREPRIAHRQFMDAVRSLEAEELAADLRITDVQLAQIDAIDAELRAALDTFKAEHQAEIDALRAKGGEMREERRERGSRGERGPDGAPGAGPDGKGKGKNKGEAPTPEVAAAREQLKALRDAGPKPEDFHTRMWAVLSAPQQTLVQSRLDNMQDDRRERMGDEMRERRGPGPDGDRPRDDRRPRGDRARGDLRSPASPPGGEAGRPRPGEGFREGPPPPPRTERSFDQRPRSDRRGPDGPPRRGVDGLPSNPRLAHFIERFNSLPPEAQDRFIQRMEEMLSKMEDRGERRGPKPPPMDDVAVPPPPADDDAGEPMPPPAPESH